MTVTAAPTAHASERELLTRYYEQDDLAARRELVERLLPMARRLAGRYSHAGEPLEDLFQVACLGLLKAIDRYDPEIGSSFASYAAPTILGELKRHFRDRGWAVHVPRSLRERAIDAGRVSELLAKRVGRAPTVREVAGKLGVTTEELLEAYEAGRSYRTASLDEPARGDEGPSVGETMGSPDPGFEAVIDRAVLSTAWRELSAIERRVLELRFFHEMTQRQIGEAIGFSQMHVSRILRRAIQRLEQVAAEESGASRGGTRPRAQL